MCLLELPIIFGWALFLPVSSMPIIFCHKFTILFLFFMLAEDGVSSWANQTEHPLSGREERGVDLKMEANESRTGAILHHVGPHSNRGIRSSVPLPSLLHPPQESNYLY